MGFGDFNELVRAIRDGATYANVHTSFFTPAEKFAGRSSKDDFAQR